MEQETQKTIIAVVALICLSALQLYAWSIGMDGAVFAVTSAIFGAIVGSYFNIKGSVKEFVEDKTNGIEKEP